MELQYSQNYSKLHKIPVTQFNKDTSQFVMFANIFFFFSRNMNSEKCNLMAFNTYACIFLLCYMAIYVFILSP